MQQFIGNFNQLSMFMLPAGHQQAISSVHYTTSCKLSLMRLRMGEIFARNMLVVYTTNRILLPVRP